MELIRKSKPEFNKNNRKIYFGIFLCPQCKEEKKRERQIGKAAKYCSHDCLTKSGGRKTNSQKPSLKAKKCEQCGVKGEFIVNKFFAGRQTYSLTWFTRKWLCHECMCGDFPADNIDQHTRSGTSNLGEWV